MPNVNRRSAIKAAAGGAVAAGTSVLAAAASGTEPKAPKLWTLEGQLKVHSKFIYRYYLVILDGQKCRAVWGRAQPRAGSTHSAPAPGERPGTRHVGDRTSCRRDQTEPVPIPGRVDAVHGCS